MLNWIQILNFFNSFHKFTRLCDCKETIEISEGSVLNYAFHICIGDWMWIAIKPDVYVGPLYGNHKFFTNFLRISNPGPIWKISNPQENVWGQYVRWNWFTWISTENFSLLFKACLHKVPSIGRLYYTHALELIKLHASPCLLQSGSRSRSIEPVSRLM